MVSAHEEMLQLFLACGIISIFLLAIGIMIKVSYQKARQEQNDRIVQSLLNEMREQRLTELRESNAFAHPPHGGRKIINVDFTEVTPDAPSQSQQTPLKYKLVYDEYLGIYRKKPR